MSPTPDDVAAAKRVVWGAWSGETGTQLHPDVVLHGSAPIGPESTGKTRPFPVGTNGAKTPFTVYSPKPRPMAPKPMSAVRTVPADVPSER